MFEERLETIRSVAKDSSYNQIDKSYELRITVITSPHTNQKHARFQSGVLTVFLLMLKL